MAASYVYRRRACESIGRDEDGAPCGRQREACGEAWFAVGVERSDRVGRERGIVYDGEGLEWEGSGRGGRMY